MKGFKILGENPSNGLFTHGGTGTSKCGTGTKSVLPFFSGLVPVPVSVVPVPLFYCHFFQPWCQYQFTKFSIILYILDFTVCSLLSLLHTLSKLT